MIAHFFRVFLILFTTALPLSAQAIPEQLTEALNSIYKGTIDTHFNVPTDHPMVYASGFEFADALAVACPDLFDAEFSDKRESMLSAYVFYNFAYLRREKFERGIGFLEATARFISRTPASELPVKFARQQLMELDLKEYSKGIAVQLGGCHDDRMTQFAANLTAIATFGRLKYTSMKFTFVRSEVTSNQIGFTCHYDLDLKDTSEQTQGYQFLTALNLIKSNGLEYYLDMFGQVVSDDMTSGPVPQRPFIRQDCPLNPDPAFYVSDVFSAPKLDVPVTRETFPKRMADYFVDVYLPDRWEKSGRNFKAPRAGYLEELRQEIINFETSDLPHWNWKARVQEYKSEHGRTLFQLTEGPEAKEFGVHPYGIARLELLEIFALE